MLSFNHAVYATLIAFTCTLILCPLLIPYLTKLKLGQQVRDDGPETHLKKAGTPTMGGIVILLSFISGAAFFLRDNTQGLMVVAITLSFGLIGFIDDYLKVVKKQSTGLKAYQKFTLQLMVTGVFAFYMFNQANFSPTIFIPFTKGFYIDLGIFYIPFLFIVMLGTVNGVNFTDGLDGLASGVTVLVATFFTFLAYGLGFQNLMPMSGAAVGALLGFLLFNTYPAKVMMGDTGSLALGGLIASIAIMMKMEFLIVIVGFIYIAEVLSVIIQVLYFKITKGKRLFKMAPLHHHFELSGWPETRVVALFYITTAIGALIGYLSTNGLFSNH